MSESELKSPKSCSKATNLHSGVGLSQSKRERRSKDDNYQRNYICGCGKSYLSYAALYTHAKTKHDGVFPEGTDTLNKRKQGRPKKVVLSEARIGSEYQKVLEFNKKFEHMLDMIPFSKSDKEVNQKDMIEWFPCEIFTKVSLFEKVLVNIEQIRKEFIETYGPSFLNRLDIVVFEINNTKKLNCDQVFALFLICVFRFVSKQFYRELVFFVVSYKSMMNAIGWEKLREMSDCIDTATNKEFCEIQTAEFLPDFCNEYIYNYYGLHCSTAEVVNSPECLSFFGSEKLSILRMVLLIRNFCFWLWTHKFTKAFVDISTGGNC